MARWMSRPPRSTSSRRLRGPLSDCSSFSIRSSDIPGKVLGPRLARVTIQQFADQPDEHPTGKQRGPVVLRRSRKDEATTTDQRLLDSRGPADWVHTDPWRVLRIQAEFVEGFGALAEVPRAVTVFGSARTPRDHPEYELGRQIGAALANAGFASITGGGPGSMEAVNRGASEAGGLSIGLGIELPFEQGLNPWVDLGVNFRYFFV